MLLKHIKESIKQKHSNNGNKSLRNNYRILTTLEDRNRYANRKYKLSLKEQLKDVSVNKELLTAVYKQAKKQGLTRKQVQQIGVLKTITLLKTVHKQK